LVVVPIIAAFATFLPVLRYPLVYDEFIHLYNLVNFGPAELLLNPHGGHLSFVGNLIYYPLYELGGVREPIYYGVLFLTHLLNVALCYNVIQRFTGRPVVAAVGATAWGCAAVNLGAVGWFAFYGEVILATVCLLLLRDLVRLASQGSSPSLWAKVRWGFLMVAACGSFGYGLIIAATFPAGATLELDEEPGWRAVSLRFLWSSLAVAILYIGLLRLHATMSVRPVLFEVGLATDRLARLSWSDVALVGRVTFDSAAYGIASLLIGPLQLVPSDWVVVLGPFKSLPMGRVVVLCRVLMLAWLAVLAMCLRGQPGAAVRRAIWLGFLALGCYGMVAAWDVGSGRIGSTAGHTLSFPPSLLVFTPYYQYLPLLLLTIATTRICSLGQLRLASVHRMLNRAVMLWCVSWVLYNAIVVWRTPVGWSAEAAFAGWLRGSIIRYPPGSTVYVDNGPAPLAFGPHDEILPGRAAFASILFPDRFVDGRQVYFVESDRELLQHLRAARSAPISRLVVSPDEVPQGATYVPG
jgi:hypothetical protein